MKCRFDMGLLGKLCGRGEILAGSWNRKCVTIKVLISTWSLSAVSVNQVGTPKMQELDGFRGDHFPYSRCFYVEGFHLEDIFKVGFLDQQLHYHLEFVRNANVQALTQISWLWNSGGSGLKIRVLTNPPSNFDACLSLRKPWFQGVLKVSFTGCSWTWMGRKKNIFIFTNF